MIFFEPSFPAMTGGDANALPAYEHYCAQLLGYGPRLRDLFAAADAAPDCILLNANAACLHLAFEGREGWEHAAPYLVKAGKALGIATEHERQFCDAVAAWSRRDFNGALFRFEALARDWPADLVAIKWGQYHAFNLGDQAALLRLGQIATEHHAGKPYVHGLLAFALEQSHDLRGAEREARLAVEVAIDDAWAHHALAHVMETEGRAQEGVKWMAHCAHIWDAKGTFIREHNWWHTALFHLALGNEAAVFEIFDGHLWGEWPEFPQEQIGAASMLWRLELQGFDAGDRWQPVADQARTRKDDHLFPFHDLHYLFALARCGRDGETEDFIHSLENRAGECCENTSTAWQQAAVPAARGIVAYARGDTDNAVNHLTAAMPYLEKIGGSHAQRAIFGQTLDAARRLTMAFEGSSNSAG
ncbi:tetratricopeptide repeat protein [Aquisalinus flavus]|uniref:Tetratricopeptide repeat protein 38 n=1 Tax=Aquisalinus flavus TaxID=1526572 RepID=A0A8J2V383_9PROT|nr:tetratricopeptide repeat protein [Aquisalinus flavus]MBD0425881.1 tetratricopeptide repeat protein [Aquisalinus flavus]UNE48522.1 tetratricopeptide repeat protein [Aquisalinus flavus]GGD12502.1 hypothetical protein GCM10011342_21620 [Aquisalinus flavus]